MSHSKCASSPAGTHSNKAYSNFLDDDPCSERCRSKQHGQKIWQIAQGGNGEAEVVCLWAKTCSNYSQVKDEFGRTALHAAATTGNLKAVEWLIKTQQCNINAKDFISGYTALHRSIYFGHMHVARSLIKHGADSNLRDNEGLTPFELCQMDRPITFKQNSGDMTELTVWGSNANYNLGIGHQQPRLHPDVAPEFRKNEMSLKKVEMNTYHTLFLTQRGKVYSCGYGMGGRLGTGDEDTVLSPSMVQLRGNGNCRDIAVGQDHSIFLTTSKVWTVGSNEFGQLGHANLPSNKLCKPRTVDTLEQYGITGILAGPFHSVFYNKQTVLVCGQNQGQFGRGFEEITNVLSPIKLRLSLDNVGNGLITAVGGNEFSTAVCVEKRYIFLLRRHQYTRIDSRGTTTQEIVKIQASGEKNSITLFLLTASGRVLVWRENFNRITNEMKGAFTRLVFSSNRLLDVKDFSVSLSNLVVVTSTGEAYKAGWNCNNPPSIVGRMEERYGQVAAADFQVAVRQRRGKREDEAPSMALELMKIKRVPNVYTGLFVSSDPKGNNFAILQRHQMMDVTDLPEVKDLICISNDLLNMYQEMTEDDSIHDVIFDFGGFNQFPGHRYILAAASPIFANVLKNNLNSAKIKVSDKLFGVDVSKCTSLENPKVFQALMDLILKLECEYTSESCMQEIINCCKSDGKRNTSLFSEKYKELGRFRNLCRHLQLDVADAVVQQCMNDLTACWELPGNENRYWYRMSGHLGKSSLPYIQFERKEKDPFVDVVLESSDKNLIPAHKCMLAARLNYFKSMFSMNWSLSEYSTQPSTKDNQATKMVLPFSAKAIAVLLECVYTNRCESLKEAELDLLCEIIACSDYMMNDRLLQMAEAEMVHNITLKNVADILQFTWKHNGSQLKKTCFDFISLNLTAMLENRLLEILSVEILEELGSYYRTAQRNQLQISRDLEACCGVPESQTYMDASKNTSEDILEQLESIVETDAAMVLKKTQVKTPRSRVRLRSRTLSESETIVECPDESTNAGSSSNLKLSCSSNLDEMSPMSPPLSSKTPMVTPPVTPGVPDKERKLIVPLPKNVIGMSTPPQKISRSPLRFEEFPTLGASAAIATSPPNQAVPLKSLVKAFSSSPNEKSSHIAKAVDHKTSPVPLPQTATPASGGKRKTKWRAINASAEVVTKGASGPGIGGTPVLEQQLTSDGRDRNNPWKVSNPTKSQKQVAFQNIVKDEVEKKKNFEKATSKPLPLMQIEDEAINYLTKLYTSKDTEDYIELLRVERVSTANFSVPTWVQHPGSITQ